jgi:hypothetical protein
MKSRTRSCVQERDVKCDLDTIINEVRQEFRKQLVKRKELIARLGNAFESVGSNPESICKKIKNSLHQEIADEVITSRDIERYCLDKWKKKTKPKNDNLSFSKQENPQQQIVEAQEGKSPTTNQTANDTSDSINQQQLNLSKQNEIDINDNSEAQLTSTTNHSKLHELKDSVEAPHKDDFTTGKILSHSSDKQECSQRVAIPKEKYAMVQDAMKKSKASIFVKFDGNNNFLGADPDVFDNSGVNHQDRNVQQSGDVAKGEHFKRHSKGNRRAVSDVRSEGVRE